MKFSKEKRIDTNDYISSPEEAGGFHRIELNNL